MFTKPEPTREYEHRDFFAAKGDVRQVWARTDGEPPELFYLRDGGVTDDIRARARAEHLLCPLPDCPAPQFVARGAQVRRHHFAHRPGTNAAHKPIDVWLHAASAAIWQWATRRYPDSIEATVTEPGTVQLRSTATGAIRNITVAYDRRSFPVTEPQDTHLLLGHDVSLLSGPEPLTGHPGLYVCTRNAIVDRAIARRGYALALNPEENRVATIAWASRLRDLLPDGANTGSAPYLIVVDDLDDCRLESEGIVTPTSAQLAELPPPAPPRPPAPPPRQPRPTVLDTPVATPPPQTRDEREKAYRRGSPSLIRRLGDELAGEIVKPLPGEDPAAGDGDCDLSAPHWRLIVADAVIQGRAEATVASIRERIGARYWGPSLTDEAIATFLDDLKSRGIRLSR